MAPSNMRDMIARPYAPNTYSRIAKAQVQRALVQNTAFDMNKS